MLNDARQIQYMRRSMPRLFRRGTRVGEVEELTSEPRAVEQALA